MPLNISQLSFKLNQVGLSNYFDMGRGPDDASWKLLPMLYQIIE
jgi:hypothetical protein